MILGREYQGWGVSAVEKFWGKNSSQPGQLEPGGANASIIQVLLHCRWNALEGCETHIQKRGKCVR